jgi:hypothetical protein
MNGYTESAYSKMGFSPKEKISTRPILQPRPILEPTPLIGPGRTTVERGTSVRTQPVDRGRVDRGFSTRRGVGDDGGNYSGSSMNDGGSNTGRIGGPRIDLNMDEQDPYEKMKKEMENIEKGRQMAQWKGMKDAASNPSLYRAKYEKNLRGQVGQNEGTIKTNLAEFDKWAKGIQEGQRMMGAGKRQGHSSPNDTRNRYT